MCGDPLVLDACALGECRRSFVCYGQLACTECCLRLDTEPLAWTAVATSDEIVSVLRIGRCGYNKESADELQVSCHTQWMVETGAGKRTPRSVVMLFTKRVTRWPCHADCLRNTTLVKLISTIWLQGCLVCLRAKNPCCSERVQRG